MSSEALQQPGRRSATSERDTTGQTSQLGSGAVPDLQAQLEAKLGRPLTKHEQAVLGRPEPRHIASDKYEMPAQARELLEIFTTFLNQRSAGRAFMYPTEPGRPLAGTMPWQLRAGKFASLVLCALPLLVVWSLASFPQLTPFLLGRGAVNILAYFTLAAVLWQQSAALERLSAERITSANLFERLMDGDDMFAELYRRTPVPWRWICLGQPPRDLRTRARLLGHYLDWFLAPPRVHFRWYWVQVALLLLGVPSVGALSLLQPGAPASPHDFFSLLFTVVGVTPTLISLWLSAHTKAVFTSALLRELRERFAVPPEPRQIAPAEQPCGGRLEHIANADQSARAAWRKSVEG